MPKTTFGALRIHWESFGKKEPLLLISGVSGGTWSWKESIEAWSLHFRVIVFDNIGAGRSSKPNRSYTIEEMADHAAAVLDAAGVKQAGVVGLSMGGMITQELALRHPDRVHRLVLGCTHCGGSKRIPPHPNVIQRFANNKGLSPEEIIDKNLTLLVTPQFLRSGSGALKRYKERQLRAPLQPDYALKRQLDAIGRFDACERIGNIQVPTLILTAEHDILVPPENGRLLSIRIPGAAEKSFAGAGHLIYLECAQNFHETVMQFFRNKA
ncbi:MAG: alpha/beta hydrolase [Desulfobacteraceae bacterium]|nr:alpha/beta hydrolase [Desulfobacteraceae bacterium]